MPGWFFLYCFDGNIKWLSDYSLEWDIYICVQCLLCNPNYKKKVQYTSLKEGIVYNVYLHDEYISTCGRGYQVTHDEGITWCYLRIYGNVHFG
jgi:hypothetical protein